MRAALISQLLLALGRCRQRLFLLQDGFLPRLLDESRLNGVEVHVHLKLRRQIPIRVDGMHRAGVHTGRAINTLVRVDDQLIIQFVKACHRTNLHTVGELASRAFARDNMRHKPPFAWFCNATSNHCRKFARFFHPVAEGTPWLKLKDAFDCYGLLTAAALIYWPHNALVSEKNETCESTVIRFGDAELILRENGRHKLISGPRSDQIAARGCILFFLHEVVAN